MRVLRIQRTALVSICVASLVSYSLVVAADRQQGQDIYETYCLACHGDNGVAMDPATPNFADGDLMFLMDRELVDRIRDGKGTMPAFQGLLSDEEIRDVIAYLRSI